MPTAASHDGMLSPQASIKDSKKATSVKAHAPIAVIGDSEIIANAPPRLLSAGCADLISNFTAIKDWKYESFGRPQIWISQTALVNYISEELKLTPSTVKSQGYYSTVLRDLIKIGFFERVQPNEFNTYIRKKNSLNSRFGTPISVYRLPYFSVHLLKVFEDRMEADMESRRDMEIQRMKLEAPKKALNFAKEEKFFKEMMEYAVKQIVLNKGRLPVLQVANHMEHLYPNLTKRHLQRKVNEHADALAQELNLEKKVVDGILKSKLSRNKETAPWAGYINRSIVLVKKPGSKLQVKEAY